MFWAEMFGVGIVDPVEDFDLLRQDPKNPLPAPWTRSLRIRTAGRACRGLGKNNYDLQRLLKMIAVVYQPSRFPGRKGSYAKYFARKFVRRLKAEEVYDSIVKATDVYTYVRDSRHRFPRPLRHRDAIARGLPRARAR